VTATEAPQRSKAARALKWYRIMAFSTGTVLILACIALLLQGVGVKHMHGVNAVMWIGHGYLFLLYCMSTVYLGITLRWPLLRFPLIGLAGTIPTMSFVAEHYVTRDVRASGAV
jgi:integral membrane protein